MPGLGAGLSDLGKTTKTSGHSVTFESNQPGQVPRQPRPTESLGLWALTEFQQSDIRHGVQPAMAGPEEWGQPPPRRCQAQLPSLGTPTPPSPHLPRPPLHSGGVPTHRSSRRARGGPPPCTPRSGTCAGGRRLCPVDTKGTREGHTGRAPSPASSLPSSPQLNSVFLLVHRGHEV